MGGIISGIVGKAFGSVFGYLNKRGERQLSRDIAFQNRLADDYTDNLIVIWFLVIMSMFFLPFTREWVTEGFMAMNATLPQSWMDNWHLIIASIFTVDGIKFGIKNFRRSKNENTPSPFPTTNIPREF